MPNADSAAARVLIADDQHNVITALRLLLKREGYQIEAAQGSAEVLEILKVRDCDLVLMDLNFTRGNTSGQEGLDLLSRIHELDNPPPVVVMTAWGNVELAVEAMRRGAKDFVLKPWENERLLSILRNQFELSGALRRGRRLEQENELLRGEPGCPLIAESRAMRPVLETIAQAGPSDANVLITGENGTGKTVVARALHAASARAHVPMVVVDIGALADTVFESELFGHVKGAFTDAKCDRMGRFELADGGTLFLDEIANIPLPLQSKLLRVVETGEFERVGASRTLRTSVRIISATNGEIHREVAEGRFRQDLLYRLNAIEIHVPPLRERREEIPVLAARFLHRYAQRYRKPVVEMDPAALQILLDYAWPGNVRELDHVVERSVLMAKGEVVHPCDLGLRPCAEQSQRTLEDMSLEEVEPILIKKALARSGGNISDAANALGLSRSALYRRLQKYGL